jgi:cyclic lactone autoinducer peptide
MKRIKSTKKVIFTLSQFLLFIAPALVGVRCLGSWGEPECPSCLK